MTKIFKVKNHRLTLVQNYKIITIIIPSGMTIDEC